METKLLDPALTRRQRVRDATLRELVAVSRELLTAHGTEGLTVRAVAREMGMTGPAVYRYFGSHQDLMDAVLVDVLGDVHRHVDDAVERVPAGAPGRRLVVASRALHGWAHGHAREFQFTLVVPVQPEAEDETVAKARRGLGAQFGALFVELWRQRGLPPEDPDEPAAAMSSLAEQLCERLEITLPTAAAVLFVRCWQRLYGVICVESVGETRAFADRHGALFEAELRDMAQRLGLPDSDLVGAD